jgi:hypothetical protein
VKEFLQGLKSDVNNDITEMGYDKISYWKCANAYSYISKIKLSESIQRIA